MVVWVTVALLAMCGFFGWRAGVLRRLFELAGVVLAIVLSARFAAAAAPWLGKHTAMTATTALLASYVLVFIAALVVVRLVAGALTKIIRWTPLGWLDRLGGAVCGLLLGALLVSVGLIAISQGPRGEGVRAIYQQHPVGQVIYNAAPALYQTARRLCGGQMDELWRHVVEVGGRIVEKSEQAAGGES